MVVVEKRKYWKMPEILYAEPDFDAARGLIRIEKLSYAASFVKFQQVETEQQNSKTLFLPRDRK